MYIYIKNLYGEDNGMKAYYRKQGDGCFDFVWRKEYATNLTAAEAEQIMSYAGWYKLQFGASEMGTEE